MKIGVLVGLLATLALAYRPGGLEPQVLTYVNFGSNPFIEDPSNPDGYHQLEGYNYGTFSGNEFNSTRSQPGLYISNMAYEVPGLGGEIELSGNMALQADWLTGTLLSPLGINLDPMYGNGQYGFFDPDQGWLFSHILTNNRIYALYARLPIARTLTNNYVAFSYLIPIANRSLYSSNELSIVLNKAHFTVSFRVQNVERVLIERVGAPIDDKFLLADDGLGLVQCMGFPDSVHVIFGTGLLTDAGNPYVPCQSASVFDQCVETIVDADQVICEYEPVQDPASYTVGLTLTVEHFAVMEWGPNFDCRNPVNLDVAAIRPEPLCFNRCPLSPVAIPNSNGCGIPDPNICYCEDNCDVDCGTPVIYQLCSESTACQVSSSCPIVYRPIDMPPCYDPPSSSSSDECCRFRVKPVRRRKSSSSSSSSCSSSSSAKPVIRRRRRQQQRRCPSSSSSSSHKPWRCQRVQWPGPRKSQNSRDGPRVNPKPTRRSPYCKPKAAHDQEAIVLEQ